MKKTIANTIHAASSNSNRSISWLAKWSITVPLDTGSANCCHRRERHVAKWRRFGLVGVRTSLSETNGSEVRERLRNLNDASRPKTKLPNFVPFPQHLPKNGCRNRLLPGHSFRLRARQAIFKFINSKILNSKWEI